MTPELFNNILFFLLAAVAVAAATLMVLSKNAVHSVLYLVLNFAIVAVFFLILGAPFIAMVQITVYAGAIMVLFLFVIMLLGAEFIRQPADALPNQFNATLFLGVIFAGVVLMFIWGGYGFVGLPPEFAGTTIEMQTAAIQNFGSPEGIGLQLFNQYTLPFEITSFLLLVGMIGAVVLVRDEKKTENPKSQPPSANR